MSITKVIAQKAAYDAEMITKFPPPILRAQIISEFMEEVIEVLVEQQEAIAENKAEIKKLIRKIKPRRRA